VATGSNGAFSLTGDYSCSSGQQLYMYVLGGTNAAAGLMAVIGSCPASGSPAIAVAVNEVTTIAAAYALAGFATDATHVSSSGTALAQVGIANAFANAANLANVSTGAALATTPAGNGTVPQLEINSLANVLAACVASNSSCSTLLSSATSDGTPTGTKPTDTATAAINLANHPGANVATLYGLASPTVYTPALTAQPNDFSIALNFTGGGLEFPEGLAADGSGNVWVTNDGTNGGGVGSSVTELSSSGAFLSGASGFTNAAMDVPKGVAIDSSGHAWVANFSGPSYAIEFSSSGSLLQTPTNFGSNSAVAIDGSGNAWFAGIDFLAGFSSSGTSLSGTSPYSGGGLTQPSGIAIDGSGSSWLTDNTGHVTKFSGSGAVLSGASGYVATACAGIAIDSSGNAWIADNAGAVIELSNSGSVISGTNGYTGGGLSGPTGIAIDGASNVWVLNTDGITELSSTGTILSGANGYLNTSIFKPFGLAIDGSGDVWASSGDYPFQTGRVLEFIGAATPVITPIAAGLPSAPTANGTSNLGTRP
jgi:hypothetical protein